MDKLPLEILHKIFVLLALDERLTCALVCRSWWRALDDHCLFYSVEIKAKYYYFGRFINMMQQSPHRAAQVQELNLDHCLPHFFNKRDLCELFPNIRHVALANSTAHFDFWKPLKLAQRTAKVESISESANFEYTSQLITSDLCGQLRYLKLDFYTICIHHDKTIAQLKNMPVLQHSFFVIWNSK